MGQCFYFVSSDASDKTVGFVVEQSDSSVGRRPVAFSGRGTTTDKSQCNYSTMEKECLAVIEALKAYVHICLDAILTHSLITDLLSGF